MAKRVFTARNLTLGTGTAANTLLTTSNYMGLKGGSSTQLIDILEIIISGLAGSSAPSLLELQRVQTLETTPTALTVATASDGPMHGATAALAAPAVSFIAASTQPTTSNAATDTKLNLGLNLFGGILRWCAAPTQQWSQIGNTATLGESVIAAFTGSTTGAANISLMYEPY